jgi:hypothetical protein
MSIAALIFTALSLMRVHASASDPWAIPVQAHGASPLSVFGALDAQAHGASPARRPGEDL